MKVVDLLKELKVIKLKYFNNTACLIEPADDYYSIQEKNEASERIIKRHAEMEKALERYNQLVDKLNISNANTYIEVMGYRFSIASALDCLRSIKTNPMTLAFGSLPPPNAIIQHPISTYLEMMNLGADKFDPDMWIDPLHLIRKDKQFNVVIGEFELELECAIKKSDCETEV